VMWPAVLPGAATMAAVITYYTTGFTIPDRTHREESPVKGEAATRVLGIG
jgi:hypothetical protein